MLSDLYCIKEVVQGSTVKVERVIPNVVWGWSLLYDDLDIL